MVEIADDALGGLWRSLVRLVRIIEPDGGELLHQRGNLTSQLIEGGHPGIVLTLESDALLQGLGIVVIDALPDIIRHRQQILASLFQLLKDVADSIGHDMILAR